MTPEEMKARTKDFAVRASRLVDALPRGRTPDVYGNQLLRSAASVGANYRAACRAKSGADFVSKLSIVEEEADESAYWMELIVERKLLKPALVETLLREANEIVSIVVASIKTVRGPRKPSHGAGHRIPQSTIRNRQSICNPQSQIRNEPPQKETANAR